MTPREAEPPKFLDHPFPQPRGHPAGAGGFPSGLAPGRRGQGGLVREAGVPHPPLLPPFSLLSQRDGSPAGARRAQTPRGERSAAPAGPAPPDTRPRPRPRPRPAAGARRAHRHESRGRGDEHADHHPLAAPGRTVCPCRLRAGADAEAELGGEGRPHRAPRALRVRQPGSRSRSLGPRCQSSAPPAAGRGSQSADGGLGVGRELARRMMGVVVPGGLWRGWRTD